jgi:outer membrane protein OmpA-like peptidoglycan-associated protein
VRLNKVTSKEGKNIKYSIYNLFTLKLKVMKRTKIIVLAILIVPIMFAGCSLTRTQKGAGIGTVAGGAAGAVIGRAAGNTAIGAVVGATVGGVTGAIIGNQMDKQAEEIKNDIPGVTVERVGEGIVVEFTNDVLFGFDSYTLTSTAKENLNKLVTILEKYPDTDIEIHGHTDSKGAANYNQSLSLQRSDAVRSYLANAGVTSSRLTALGFGESQPKYSNETADSRSKNRRVEFAITANEKMKREAEQAGN